MGPRRPSTRWAAMVALALAVSACAGSADPDGAVGSTTPESGSVPVEPSATTEGFDPDEDAVPESDDSAEQAGDDGSTDSSTAEADSVVVEMVEDLSLLDLDAEMVAVELLSVSLGTDATVAVVSAIERGYDADQIIAAAGSQDLATDGTITDVEPSGARAGVIGISSAAAGGGVAHAVYRGQSEVELVPTRTVLEAIADYGSRYGTGDPGREGLAAVLMLRRHGYGAAQIVEFLTYPDAFFLGFARVDDLDADLVCGGLVFDATTGQVVQPAAGRSDPECEVILGRLLSRSTTEVFLRGELTQGQVIDGPTIIAVVDNEFDLLLDLDAGVVAGEGVVAREADTSTAVCTDRKVSPLDFVIEGVFTDGTQTAEGTFTYRVAAERFVQLELSGNCPDEIRFGSGAGTWSGEWIENASVFEMKINFGASVFGTNELEFRRPG